MPLLTMFLDVMLQVSSQVAICLKIMLGILWASVVQSNFCLGFLLVISFLAAYNEKK